MSKCTFLLKFCVVLYVCVTVVDSECVLNLPSEFWSKPVYEMSFGTRKKNVTVLERQVRLADGDSITGNCATKFDNILAHSSWSGPFSEEGKRKIQLKCNHGRLMYMYKETEYYELLSNPLSCVPLEWGIYESETPFPWCASSHASYLLGTKSLAKHFSLAAACYDFEKTSLLSLRYFAGPKSSFVNYDDLLSLVPSELSDLKLAVEVPQFDIILNHMRENATENPQHRNKKCNSWLELATNLYDHQPIVQGGPFAEYFKQFDLFLDTIWWPTLRLGNWKRFLDALDERSSNKAYNLYAGTSGAVSLPAVNGCAPADVQQLKMGYVNRTVPAYIWTYVQATDKNEEFVVVAYNSPFYQFRRQEEVVFCKDICDQIDWLKDVHSTFHRVSVGVMFCCDVNEVREHGYLDGFPLSSSAAEPASSTAFPYTIPLEEANLP